MRGANPSPKALAIDSAATGPRKLAAETVVTGPMGSGRKSKSVILLTKTSRSSFCVVSKAPVVVGKFAESVWPVTKMPVG